MEFHKFGLKIVDPCTSLPVFLFLIYSICSGSEGNKVLVLLVGPTGIRVYLYSMGASIILYMV